MRTGVVWADPRGGKVVFSASVLGERPRLLRGSVESRRSPAGCVVSQLKLCTEDKLHGASPALDVRDAVAAAIATEHPPVVGLSPGRPA